MVRIVPPPSFNWAIPIAGAAAALPAALCLAWLAWGLPPTAAVGSWTVRVYVVLLGATLFAAAVIALVRKRPRDSLTAISALLLFGWGFAALHFHYQGTLSLGEGEPGGAFEGVLRGPGGVPPRDRIEFAGADASAAGGYAVAIAGEHLAAPVGKWVRHRRMSVRLTGVHAAPAVTLAAAAGRIEDQMLVKLRFSDPPDNYFQMGLLPYRFYARLPDHDPPPVPGELPTRIGMRVMRGKLTVARGAMARGEAIAFEGFQLTYAQGAPWADLEVRTRPRYPLFPLLAGLGLAAGLIEGLRLPRREP